MEHPGYKRWQHIQNTLVTPSYRYYMGWQQRHSIFFSTENYNICVLSCFCSSLVMFCLSRSHSVLYVLIQQIYLTVMCFSLTWAQTCVSTWALHWYIEKCQLGSGYFASHRLEHSTVTWKMKPTCRWSKSKMMVNFLHY